MEWRIKHQFYKTYPAVRFQGLRLAIQAHKKSKLSAAQILVFTYIAEQGIGFTETLSSVAQATDLHVATVSRAVEKLTKNGWLEVVGRKTRYDQRKFKRLENCYDFHPDLIQKIYDIKPVVLDNRAEAIKKQQHNKKRTLK
jgi:DNA-binding MarR family transcriptional regulator